MHNAQRQCGIAAEHERLAGACKGSVHQPGSGVAAMGSTPITMLHLETMRGLTSIRVQAFQGNSRPKIQITRTSSPAHMCQEANSSRMRGLKYVCTFMLGWTVSGAGLRPYPRMKSCGEIFARICLDCSAAEFWLSPLWSKSGSSIYSTLWKIVR